MNFEDQPASTLYKNNISRNNRWARDDCSWIVGKYLLVIKTHIHYLIIAYKRNLKKKCVFFFFAQISSLKLFLYFVGKNFHNFDSETISMVIFTDNRTNWAIIKKNGWNPWLNLRKVLKKKTIKKVHKTKQYK